MTDFIEMNNVFCNQAGLSFGTVWTRDEAVRYHINTRDAGFYQLKAVWKLCLPEEFEEFKRRYRILADKMRPMVYELGFLRR